MTIYFVYVAFSFYHVLNKLAPLYWIHGFPGQHRRLSLTPRSSYWSGSHNQSKAMRYLYMFFPFPSTSDELIV